MNGVTVTIGGVDYPMRWEVGPVHEFETLHPSLGGAAVAWSKSSFDMDSLFSLWTMCLRCKDGNPKIAEAAGLALLQDFIDEGHDIEEAYELVGEAGIAGRFYKRVTPDEKAEASPPTPEDGTTAP